MEQAIVDYNILMPGNQLENMIDYYPFLGRIAGGLIIRQHWPCIYCGGGDWACSNCTSVEASAKDKQSEEEC